MFWACNFHVKNSQFNEQFVVILWVGWCKKKSFWQRFTYTEPIKSNETLKTWANYKYVNRSNLKFQQRKTVQKKKTVFDEFSPKFKSTYYYSKTNGKRKYYFLFLCKSIWCVRVIWSPSAFDRSFVSMQLKLD